MPATLIIMKHTAIFPRLHSHVTVDGVVVKVDSLLWAIVAMSKAHGKQNRDQDEALHCWQEKGRNTTVQFFEADTCSYKIWNNKQNKQNKQIKHNKQNVACFVRNAIITSASLS